jgi:hypothetical protein
MRGPSCPDREAWDRFARGGVDDDLLDAMGDHLGKCQPCRDLFADFEHAGCDLVDELSMSARRPALRDHMPEPGGPGMTTLGRFVIHEWLGAGGLGAVYRAFDPDRGHDVALKLLLPHAAFDARWRRRFLNEGGLAGLDHPHVVRAFEAGRAEGVDYVAMEYCAGPSLARWLAMREGPVPARLAARIIAEAAEGAAFCHDRGVVHRDISATNVLLFPQDPWPAEDPAFDYTVKLADFGLAKGLPRSVAREGADTLTATGAILGKLEYLAPELLRDGCKAVAPRVDVFALGVLLYELLVGQSPFRGINPAQTLRNLENHEPPPPRSRRPEVARDLETICRTCLEKDPRSRYASARELADDLHRWLDGRPIAARPASPPEKAWRWCRRRPAVAALAGILALTLAASFVSVLLLWWRADAERRRAEADFQTTNEILGQIVEQDVPRASWPVGDRAGIVASLQQTRRRLLAVAARRPDQRMIARHLAFLDYSLGLVLMQEQRFDEARSLSEESLRYHEGVLRQDPLDHMARARQINAFFLVAQLADRQGRPDEVLSHHRRAVDAGEELVRNRLNASTICLLTAARSRLARLLARRGDQEQARSLTEASRRLLEDVPREAEGLEVAVWRLLVQFDLERFHAPANPAAAAARDEGSGPADTLTGLAGPDTDRSPPGDWAERATRALRSAAHPGLGTGQESEAGYILVDHMTTMAGERRNCGRLDEARRTADRMLAFARLLVERHPDRSSAHLALCDAYTQLYKNAWRVPDRAAVERHMRLALDAALQAQLLDANNRLVRHKVDGLQRRLKDLLDPAQGDAGAGGGAIATRERGRGASP